jgi:ATP-dependent Clp protease protease subunit
MVKDDIDRFFQYNIDPSSRTIFLEAEVDEYFAEYAIKGLRILETQSSTKPITIIMNNYGGDELSGLAVYDYIKLLTKKVEVNIDVFGGCMSMGAWILQAGTRRRMAKHSKLMVHIGYMELEMNHPQILKNWMKEAERDEPIFEDILLERIREKHPKYTRARLQKLLAFDSFFSAQEAVDLGLADEILE